MITKPSTTEGAEIMNQPPLEAANFDAPSLFFTEDHRRCDAIWARVETALDAGDTEAAKSAFAEFDRALRRHLAMEEEVLFPAFEAATGMRGAGPTAVMRHEHQQMRGVLDQMAQAAGSGEVDDLVDYGDTLLMLIQQHNLKEESVLYSMSDRMIDDWGALQASLARY